MESGSCTRSKAASVGRMLLTVLSSVPLAHPLCSHPYPSLTCNTIASSARPFSLLTVLACVVSLTVLRSLTLATLT